MRVLLQRVRRASVAIENEPVAQIGHGLLLFVGVGQGDGPAEAEWLARKCAGLRVFEDEEGKSNLSVMDVGGEALVVSQFTLYADTDKGRRPSFISAAAPEVAEPLVDRFATTLAEQGVPVEQGEFGAHMSVELVNDGPVTIWLEKELTGAS